MSSSARDLVLGHWPKTEPESLRRDGDAHMAAHGNLLRAADNLAAQSVRTQQTIHGASATGMAERHRAIEQALRDKAAVCENLGQQCYSVADSTVRLQHLLIVSGIVLGAQLTYDMLLFFQGGGMKAMADRLAAEQTMRAMVARFTAEVAERAASGAVRRAALHGALHAAKIGGSTGAITSVGAQIWDNATGVAHGFDALSFVELTAGGLLGGLVGAEVGRRLAPSVLQRIGSRASSDLGRLAAHMGGTMLIGGAGGAAGGVVGAIPAVIIRHNEIHSLGDLFKVARQAAVTGLAGGFLGAATNSLRPGVHPLPGGTAQTAPYTPAALVFVRGHHQDPIYLQPGHERTLDAGFFNGRTQAYEDGQPVNKNEVRIGRDHDGRIWVHDLQSDGSLRTMIDGEPLSFNEKRYLTADTVLEFGDVTSRVRLGPEAPIELRLFDDPKIPPVMLAPGERLVLGRGPESPLSEHFTDMSISAQHAVIYRDERGHVWISDEHSRSGTWVESHNKKLDPGRPVRIHPGDRFSMGEWAGSAQYSREGIEHPDPRPTPVHVNSPHGGFPLEVKRGGDPVLLGRDDPRLPAELPGRQQISPRHLSIGVHPSGRVWIRDEGSANGTTVGGVPIRSGEQVTVNPGDTVSLANGAYEFILNYPPPAGGPFIHRLDSLTETMRALNSLAQIQYPIFERVTDHFNEAHNGVLVFGRMPVTEMPGAESVVRNFPEGPGKGRGWNEVAGMYDPNSRRLYVDSTFVRGDWSDGLLVWHEFGHAASHAYGSDDVSLHDQQQWAAIHNDMMISISKHAGWDDYYDSRTESFAEAFSAWMVGPEQLKIFARGDARIAERLRDYFEKTFE
ncbi:FHA domain-containing protein [Nocardia acidivorans]|uniref:FHA domain-containing protein n=1 Tax=Nocardia acidivorans TaxID=404580 RepID=UPI001471739A|nr:FHA domain-containing protein [Nocardia acidivorans]